MTHPLADIDEAELARIGALLHSNDNGASFSAVPTEGNRVYSGVLPMPDGRIPLVGFGGISTLTAERGDD